MALTDLDCRHAKVKDRPYKLADSGGLHLYVTPTSKLWRMKYRFHGKEKLLSLGAYGPISLAQARDAANEARILPLAVGGYFLKQRFLKQAFPNPVA